jgi:hypothetical protein
MNYSIAKMIEFAFSYILLNELLTKKYDIPEEKRQILIDYFNTRISEIRSQYK